MKKYVTFMVVPDGKNKIRKIVISGASIKLLGYVTGLLIVIFLSVLVDYMGLWPQSKETRRLRDDNAELHSQLQVVAGKINSVEATLEKLKKFSAKMRSITAINDPERGLQMAMGPLSKEESDAQESSEPQQERIPSSAIYDRSLFKAENLQTMIADDLSQNEDADGTKLNRRLDQISKVCLMEERDFLTLWETLQDRTQLLSATPSTKPVNGFYTSRFGYRMSPYADTPMMHEGVDIAAPPGTPVYATADGIVKFAGYGGGYGNLVVIDHGYGVETRFGHNSLIRVKTGQKVRRGDPIAAVGSTGRSTGPHCHYEVRVNGQPVDPLNYILEE